MESNPIGWNVGKACVIQMNFEWQANIFQSETPVLAVLIWGFVFNADVRAFMASAFSLRLFCIRSDFM